MKKNNQDELYKIIGKISIYFNGLEICLKLVVWDLMGTDQYTGEIITSDLSFPNLVKLLRSLSKNKITNETGLEKIDEICRSAFNVNDKRNQIIHSLWTINLDNQTELLRYKVTAKYKNGLKHTFQKENINELKEFADNIEHLIKDVSEISLEQIKGKYK